jgi:hypothetical protein
LWGVRSLSHLPEKIIETLSEAAFSVLTLLLRIQSARISQSYE